MERLSITLFGLLTFFLLVRTLNKEDFGVWALFVSVTTIVELVRHGLVRSPLIKYLAVAERSEHGTIQSASFVVNIAYTVLSALLLILLAQPLGVVWEAQNLDELFYIYSITSIFLLLFTHCECVQHAYLDFKGTFIGYLVQKGFFFSYY